MSNQASETWNCPHCEENSTGYPALSRRDNKTDICSKCGEIEAFVDMSDCLSDDFIHWEFRFQQLHCGNDKLDGHDTFHDFLKFRKSIGKNDRPLWQTEWSILSSMFPKADYEAFMSTQKSQYDKIEESWI